MAKAVVFFAEGTEECEALLVVDLLRRAKVEVLVASASGSREILSSHKVHITADALAEEVDYSDVDLVVLPGGIPGTPNLAANKTVTDTCVAFAKAGKKVAAICAAPSVLAALGLLEGKNATAHAAFQDKLAGAHVLDTEVVVDGNITTSYGLGSAIPFAGAGAPAGRRSRSRPHPQCHRLPALRGGDYMRFVTCRLPDGMEDPAILSQDGTQVWPLSWLGLSYETLSDAIPFLTPQVRFGLHLAISGIPALLVEAVTLQSPIPCPAQDVICLGINYMAHSDEAEKYSADAFSTQHQDAIYFSKRVSRAVPDGGFIEAHTDLVQKLDYECELAVVLGKDAKDVPAGQTKDYVFGYTILNDVSARDVQTAHKQWYFGKSLDGFTPMGPCIVTADEFDTYPPALPIRSRVNGELRQDSNTKLQIFDIDHVIHELSQGMTLKAGTIIATGTPAGVGMGMDPPQFLHPGDTVQCEIEGIGTLTNTVR